MSARQVSVGPLTIGNDLPFVLIAGPCQIESRAHALETAEAVVQVGNNLVTARLADEAERWTGVPVIAINAALLWHGLRKAGINDQVRGFGTLLRDF